MIPTIQIREVRQAGDFLGIKAPGMVLIEQKEETVIFSNQIAAVAPYTTFGYTIIFMTGSPVMFICKNSVSEILELIKYSYNYAKFDE